MPALSPRTAVSYPEQSSLMRCSSNPQIKDERDLDKLILYYLDVGPVNDDDGVKSVKTSLTPALLVPRQLVARDDEDFNSPIPTTTSNDSKPQQKDIKTMMRRLRNREHSRNCRIRKKCYMKQLKARTANLEAQIEHLKNIIRRELPQERADQIFVEAATHHSSDRESDKDEDAVDDKDAASIRVCG